MDMVIFPHRLLGADATEKLWIDSNDMEISELFMDKDSLQQMPSIRQKRNLMSKERNYNLLVKTDEFF